MSNLIHLGWSWKQCDVLPRDGSTGRAPRPVATQWGPAGRVMSQSGDRGFWELLRKKKKRIEAPAPSIGRSCRRPTGCRFNDSGLVGHVDMSPDWLIQPLKSSRDESLMDATGHWSINQQQQQQQQHMIRRSLIHGAARHLWTATRQPSTASLNHDPRFESFMLTLTLVESTPWPGWCRKVSLDGRGMAWRGPRSSIPEIIPDYNTSAGEAVPSWGLPRFLRSIKNDIQSSNLKCISAILAYTWHTWAPSKINFNGFDLRYKISHSIVPTAQVVARNVFNKVLFSHFPFWPASLI